MDNTSITIVLNGPVKRKNTPSIWDINVSIFIEQEGGTRSDLLEYSYKFEGLEEPLAQSTRGKMYRKTLSKLLDSIQYIC